MTPVSNLLFAYMIIQANKNLSRLMRTISFANYFDFESFVYKIFQGHQGEEARLQLLQRTQSKTQLLVVHHHQLQRRLQILCKLLTHLLWELSGQVTKLTYRKARIRIFIISESVQSDHNNHKLFSHLWLCETRSARSANKLCFLTTQPT